MHVNLYTSISNENEKLKRQIKCMLLSTRSLEKWLIETPPSVSWNGINPLIDADLIRLHMPGVK